LLDLSMQLDLRSVSHVARQVASKSGMATQIRRLGRNNGDRRWAVGLTQEQLAEYIEIDTLTVSRHGTGNILLPLTVVEQCSVEAKCRIRYCIRAFPVAPILRESDSQAR